VFDRLRILLTDFPVDQSSLSKIITISRVVSFMSGVVRRGCRRPLLWLVPGPQSMAYKLTGSHRPACAPPVDLPDKRVTRKHREHRSKLVVPCTFWRTGLLHACAAELLTYRFSICPLPLAAFASSCFGGLLGPAEGFRASSAYGVTIIGTTAARSRFSTGSVTASSRE
jgi:hypothetical protein